ncbi:MAG: ABC transporter ATP-binding protein, partial [Lachnospiraceae bacterium]|nr:ABC transporter ATP-binding protein [Lachnospiraceae bacterium]
MDHENGHILSVKDLSIRIGEKQILSGVSFYVDRGETVGIVGETGSGKSMTAMAVMGLLPPGSEVTGEILFDGKKLNELPEKEQAQIRGNDLSMVFQDPMTFMDPVMKVGPQVGEPLKNHGVKDKKERKRRVLELFNDVSFPDPELVYRSYPHELSGGMRQRALIAEALICEPKLLIADEPTTALDPKVADDILSLIEDLNRKRADMSMLFISHDLNIIRRMCDRVLVMYQGRLIEHGRTEEVFEKPKEEYTKTLVADIPSHTEVSGEEKKVLELKDISAFYVDDRHERHDILEHVSFTVHENETLGLVGESGSGKSTLARIITGLN